MSVEQASGKMQVDPERLKQWESGDARLTVKQLQRMATVYKQPFAAFYLPSPPPDFMPPLKDYRLLPGVSGGGMSPELTYDVRRAMDRRSIALELYAETNVDVPQFAVQKDLKKNAESLAQTIRQAIGITIDQQIKWQDQRVAFNEWRRLAESAGVLVFQATRVPLEEMRGYSVAEFPLPVIVVNRKDAYSGRIFTLLHEFAHLALRASGVCNLNTSQQQPPEQRRVEVFCNHVAGAGLLPRREFLSDTKVSANKSKFWDDQTISDIANKYNVSREVTLRRLLELKRTTRKFYAMKRVQFQKEYEKLETGGGPIPRAVDVVSMVGKPFTRMVLHAFHSEKITDSDVSDYLDVRLKHLDKISEAVGMK